MMNMTDAIIDAKKLPLLLIGILIFTVPADGVQDYDALRLNCPPGALEVLNNFHTAMANHDERAVRSYVIDEDYSLGSTPATIGDYRILTVGPSPEAKEGSDVIPGDLAAWVEVKMNKPKWGNPHRPMLTVLTKRSGEWTVLFSVLMEVYGDQDFFYLPEVDRN